MVGRTWHGIPSILIAMLTYGGAKSKPECGLEMLIKFAFFGLSSSGRRAMRSKKCTTQNAIDATKKIASYTPENGPMLVLNNTMGL